MKMNLNQLVELPGTCKSAYCIFPSLLLDDHLNQSRVKSHKVSIIYNLCSPVMGNLINNT